MELQFSKIELPKDVQIIVAQSHFIKTVEDVSECLVTVKCYSASIFSFFNDNGAFP
jgi:adenosine/AMP kinase